MGYSYYRSITIDHTQVSASSSTYLRVPVFGNASFATIANGGRLHNSNGYDLIFATDISGSSPLTFELEENSYNATTGAGLWWVRIPFPSTSSNTVFYVVYGNAAISTYQGNTNGTWGTDYTAVIHFNASGTQVDSTSNANNLNGSGGSPAFAAGLLGLAFQGNGSSYVYANSVTLPLDGPCALSAWYKFSSSPGGGNSIAGIGGNGGTNSRALIFPTSTVLAIDTSSADVESTLAWSTNWVYVVVVLPTSATPNNMAVYVNGVLTSGTGGNNSSFNLPSTGSNLCVSCITGDTGAGTNMTGLVDEIRLSGAIDAGLVATDFAAQQPSTTFYSLGSEQTEPTGPNIRVQQAILELQALMNPHARVQQAMLEFMTLNDPHARVQQVVLEMQVLEVPNPAVNTEPFSIILRGVKRWPLGQKPSICPMDEKQHDDAMEELTKWIG